MLVARRSSSSSASTNGGLISQLTGSLLGTGLISTGLGLDSLIAGTVGPALNSLDPGVLLKLVDNQADLTLFTLDAGGITKSYVSMGGNLINTANPVLKPVLDALPAGTFQVVVTGDAVQQGKPHPEPYLKAAALLGVSPAGTVAIEDSNTGARSAEAAGCTVLVVPNHVPVLEGERRVFADVVPSSWDELRGALSRT